MHRSLHSVKVAGQNNKQTARMRPPVAEERLSHCFVPLSNRVARLIWRIERKHAQRWRTLP